MGSYQILKKASQIDSYMAYSRENDCGDSSLLRSGTFGSQIPWFRAGTLGVGGIHHSLDSKHNLQLDTGSAVREACHLFSLCLALAHNVQDVQDAHIDR